MSPEPSSWPPPGAARERPLWVREHQGAAARASAALDVALKAVTAAYLLMAAWQVAKILSPPLQVRQDLAVAALRRRLARARAELPELSAGDTRQIYDDTR